MLSDPHPQTQVHAPATTPLEQLLQKARTAHGEYQELVPRTISGRLVGSLTRAREALDRAYNAREAADVLDPDHSDAAWADDAQTHNHRALMAFYREQRKLRS